MTKLEQKINDELEKFKSDNVSLPPKTAEEKERAVKALDEMRKNLEKNGILKIKNEIPI